MAIESIDLDLCNGCSICCDACVSDVLRWDEAANRPVIAYPEDCILCMFCELDCPEKAIYISPIKRNPANTTVG